MTSGYYLRFDKAPTTATEDIIQIPGSSPHDYKTDLYV